MYLDYDTAPAHIKARLKRLADIDRAGAAPMLTAIHLLATGKIKHSKYQGFLYQRKGRPGRGSPVFFDKIGFDENESRKAKANIAMSNAIFAYHEASRAKGAKIPSLTSALVAEGYFSNQPRAWQYLYSHQSYQKERVNKRILEFIKEHNIKVESYDE